MSTIQFSNLKARGDIAYGLGGSSEQGNYGLNGYGTGGGYIYLENGTTLSGTTAGQIYAPGMVIQTAYVQSSRTRQNVFSDSLANIPELSISFACKYSNSWLLLRANIQATGRHVSTFGFKANGTNVYSLTNTNSDGSVSTNYRGDDTDSYMRTFFIMGRYTPGTTSAITYTCAASASWAGGTRNCFINDRDSSDMRGTSVFTIMEIAV
jgi:hypothetical protein